MKTTIIAIKEDVSEKILLMIVSVMKGQGRNYLQDDSKVRSYV